MKTEFIEISAGLLYRKAVRNYLNKAKFADLISNFIEEKRLLESKFTIKNPHDKIKQELLLWIEEVQEQNLKYK